MEMWKIKTGVQREEWTFMLLHLDNEESSEFVT